MQSLKLEPLSRLIPLLPVDNHAVRVKASNWQEHFSASGLDSKFQEIFGRSKEVRLTRKEIRDQRDEHRKCLEILLWGYPSGMRGNHHLDYLRNAEGIAAHAGSEKAWPEYYAALNSLSSLGISTVTKIAYFFDRSFGSHKALILDSRLIDVVSRSIWDELRSLEGLTYGNAVKKYMTYLEVLTDAAQGIRDAEPDQVEFFLFTLGCIQIKLRTSRLRQFRFAPCFTLIVRQKI